MKQAKNGPICLWSGPRNVSTALMYSMAELDDIRVVDEPLYGHYLAVSGADHPGRDEVMASMNCDANSVMDDLIAQQLAEPRPRLFLKHMAHHLVDLDLGFLSYRRPNSRTLVCNDSGNCISGCRHKGNRQSYSTPENCY